MSQLGAYQPLRERNISHMKSIERYALILAVCFCSCALAGCVESNFTLASESKLPKSTILPPGLTRKDVSVTLALYAPLRGPDAKFVIRDRKGKKLAEVKGKTQGPATSKYLPIVSDEGDTEIIELQPYREHANMEQNGRAVALFYVIDDPAIANELLDRLQRK